MDSQQKGEHSVNIVGDRSLLRNAIKALMDQVPDDNSSSEEEERRNRSKEHRAAESCAVVRTSSSASGATKAPCFLCVK